MKQIPGHRGYYINTQGEVFHDNVKLKPWLHNNGYLKVNLEYKKPYSIHRLLAITFITNPGNKRCVCHRNNIKTDNRVENLYWGTQKENVHQAINDGIMRVNGKDNPMYGMYGELNPNAKLTNEQREEIVKRMIDGESAKRLSIEYKVTLGYVYYLKRKQLIIK